LALQRATAGEQISGVRGGGEDGNHMTEVAQLLRGTSEVNIDLVRLRPGKWRDEADAQAHGRRV
jgi:hypothetical protein